MRANHPGGRFSVEQELDRIAIGINEDLRRPVGDYCDWWVFDSSTSTADAIYDVGSSAIGRKWIEPFRFPFIVAQVFQGETMQNDRGFYNNDLLRLTVNMHDANRLIPGFVTDPDPHLKDRAIYRGKVFRPSRAYLRGQVINRYTILTMDLVQVMPEEMVNDDQFLSYSE